MKRPVEAERCLAPPLAHGKHCQKAPEGHPIGRVARDGGDPPHGCVVGRARRRLRREAFEQAPRVVEPSAYVVGDGETKPVGH